MRTPDQCISQRFQNLRKVSGHTFNDPELFLWLSAQRNEDGESLVTSCHCCWGRSMKSKYCPRTVAVFLKFSKAHGNGAKYGGAALVVVKTSVPLNMLPIITGLWYTKPSLKYFVK